MLKKFGPYLGLILLAVGLSIVVHNVEALRHAFTTPPEGLYLVIALLFALGYGLNLIAPKTVIPSFVWAIAFGIALQPMLKLLTHEIESLRVVVELLAALVLFGGGVEVPWKNFLKHIGPIASLAFLGTVVSAVLFALFLSLANGTFSLAIPAGAFVLLGAILASTDPTAIIPSLSSLRFRKPFLKDLAISESAVNDVVGTILTRFFIVIVLVGGAAGSVMTIFRPFFERKTLDSLALTVLWGVIVGVMCASLLKRWSERVRKNGESKQDPALFFAVPIFAYAFGGIVGGSGFLAAFVAGLLFDGSSHTKEVRHFFETFVDRFIKPVIFVLLGAVIPLSTMISLAGIGIASALAFMFIIRPLVVVFSLIPWIVRHRAEFEWRELVFLSFIRETGVIPAVLMLVAAGSGVAGSQYIFAIGMWVILLTLLIEPPLTPWLAKRLGIAK